MHDGPLDMRMSAAVDPLTGEASDTGESAADFINTADEDAIANVIYIYGEEHKSRSIARAIVKARTDKPLDANARTRRPGVAGLSRPQGRRPSPGDADFPSAADLYQ